MSGVSEHTPEPWGFDKFKPHKLRSYAPEFGLGGSSSIAFITEGPQRNAKNDFRRILACINACKGIPTENLERSAAWLRRKAASEETRCQSRPSEAEEDLELANLAAYGPGRDEYGSLD